MAIVGIDPSPINGANSVLVDSDAPDNRQAIAEIDAWASAQGFARTPEYWLQQIFRDGRRLFRGFCYRLTPEVNTSNSTVVTSIFETRESLSRRQG